MLYESELWDSLSYTLRRSTTTRDAQLRRRGPLPERMFFNTSVAIGWRIRLVGAGIGFAAPLPCASTLLCPGGYFGIAAI